jgi:hypothetical protein
VRGSAASPCRGQLPREKGLPPGREVTALSEGREIPSTDGRKGILTASAFSLKMGTAPQPPSRHEIGSEADIVRPP